MLLQIRPLTHDLMKNMLQDIGYRVTKVSQHRHSTAQHSSPGEVQQADAPAIALPMCARVCPLSL